MIPQHINTGHPLSMHSRTRGVASIHTTTSQLDLAFITQSAWTNCNSFPVLLSAEAELAKTQ